MTDMNRRKLLTASATGLAAAATLSACAKTETGQKVAAKVLPARSGASVANLVVPKMDKVRVAFIGVGVRGRTLLRLMCGVDGAEVVAICDNYPPAIQDGLAIAKKEGGYTPDTYGDNEDSWKEMLERDDIDAVFIVTPWHLHVPMALAAMESKKQTFVEVPAAMTVEENWQLVNAAEKHQVNCMMLENVCYNRAEMMTLNMVRAKVFGDLLHGEAAYIHELRFQMEHLVSGTGSWRTEWHSKRNANLYPTHGLGPIAQYMNINRGDQFDYINSTSSLALGRKQYADEYLKDDNRHKQLDFICGDINTSIITTVKGRTIMLQHDTTTPRPYSRHNLIQGTNGVFAGWPNRIALEDNPFAPDVKDGYHQWDEDMEKWQDKYDHSIWKKMLSDDTLAGKTDYAAHGGMDFVMLWRIIYCLRNGVRLDQNVYDAAAWSVIVELSEQSVKKRGAPMDFPDFTRGEWKTLKQLEI